MLPIQTDSGPDLGSPVSRLGSPEGNDEMQVGRQDGSLRSMPVKDRRASRTWDVGPALAGLTQKIALE